MNEEQIRKIVKEEIDKNYRSGNPKTPPHVHNGIDNLKISQANIVEFLPLPTDGNGVAQQNTLSGTNFVQDFEGNQNVYILPQIVGGVHGAFNGGNAPDGTLIAIHTAGTHQLAVCLDNTWYAVTLT